MQERWAIMNSAGDWARDDLGKVLVFFAESTANGQCAALQETDATAGWTIEPFTLEDALEEAARSPFASEGGL